MIMAEDKALILGVGEYTLTPKVRRHALINALRQIDHNEIDGDIVECGVWRGGNIILARKVSPERTCWLYDTFTGMTEPGPEDQRRSGSPASEYYAARKRTNTPWCMSSLAETTSALRATDTYDEEKIKFVVGDVTKTLLIEENLPEKIALLRLDTDWYESTKVELEVLYPRLCIGGVLIIDDFGHWNGARKAVVDYFKGDISALEHIDYAAVMRTK